MECGGKLQSSNSKLTRVVASEGKNSRPRLTDLPLLDRASTCIVGRAYMRSCVQSDIACRKVALIDFCPHHSKIQAERF